VTAVGELLVCNVSAEYILALPDSPFHLHKAAVSVECLAVTHTGFVVGCEGSEVLVYERQSNPKQLYQNCRRVVVGEGFDAKETSVCGLSVAPNNDYRLVCMLSSSQIFSINLEPVQEGLPS